MLEILPLADPRKQAVTKAHTVLKDREKWPWAIPAHDGSSRLGLEPPRRHTSGCIFEGISTGD